MIEEIEGINLPREMRPYRHEARFVSWLPGRVPSDPTSYPEAVREAIALGAQGCVGFLCDEPAAAPPVSKPDYSAPVPSVLGRKKRRCTS